jgi:hypothetical protein
VLQQQQQQQAQYAAVANANAKKKQQQQAKARARAAQASSYNDTDYDNMYDSDNNSYQPKITFRPKYLRDANAKVSSCVVMLNSVLGITKTSMRLYTHAQAQSYVCMLYLLAACLTWCIAAVICCVAQVSGLVKAGTVVSNCITKLLSCTMCTRTYTVASSSTSHNKYEQVAPDTTPAATPTVNGSSANTLPFSSDEAPAITNVVVDGDAATAEATIADTQQQQSSLLEVSALPLYRACLEGYLMLHEYTIITACIAYVVLTVTFGLVLTIVQPHWFGHIVWCSMLMVAITALTVAKYIETRAIDRKMACNIVLVSTVKKQHC